jgi:hypothetical protein
VSDADVRAKITPDYDIGACCEGALRSLVPHGQHWRGWWAHDDQLYRPRAQLQAKYSTPFTTSTRERRATVS